MKLLFLTLLLTTSIIPSSLPGVKNFHKVSDTLYRSAQPTGKGMKSLEERGIRTILNLRLHASDIKELKNRNLRGEWVKIPTKRMTYDQMVSAMKKFHSAEKPVLVHCRRGSDRTGCFVACYRILYEGWQKERALDSLLHDGKGYYENLFPNLKEFIIELDTAQFRKDVFDK